MAGFFGERNEKGGLFNKGDLIIVKPSHKRLGDNEGFGVGFLVEMDSAVNMAGMRTDEELLSFVRAGGVAGTRIDTLIFLSTAALEMFGETAVIQIIDTLGEEKVNDLEFCEVRKI